jgi:hypothetical protein
MVGENYILINQLYFLVMLLQYKIKISSMKINIYHGMSGQLIIKIGNSIHRIMEIIITTK